MATANCERCGRETTLEEGVGRHAICDACRRAILATQQARRQARRQQVALLKTALEEAQPAAPARPRPQQPEAPAPQLPSQPPVVSRPLRVPLSYYVAAALVGGLLAFIGLVGGYLLWGRPQALARRDIPIAGQPTALADAGNAVQSPDAAGPASSQPGTSGTRTAGTESDDERSPDAAPAEVPDTPPEPATPEPAAPETAIGAPAPVPEPAGPEDAGGEATASAEDAVVQPVVPEQHPEMSPKTAASIARAKRSHARYQVISPVQALLSNYRFSQAVSRLEKKDDKDEFRDAVLKDIRTAATVLDGMGRTAAALSGKRVELRLPSGRLKGTVRGYSPGMVTLMNDAGAPCLVSFKRAPFDFLRDLAKDAGDQDFALFCIYSGRGLPEGGSRPKLSEAAKRMLAYPAWSRGEKKALDALKRLRELRKDEKWPEVVSGAVGAAQEHIGTYAVGVAGRGEIADMLREALKKKTKTVTYQHKVSPSPDYDGVTDTYISCNRNEGPMNFGGKDTMEFWQQERFPMIRFELTGLPNDVKVHKATLEFFVNKTSYEQKLLAAVYLLAEEWAEGNQTWGGAKSGATWHLRDVLGGKKWTSPGGDILKDDFGQEAAGVVTYAKMAKGQWAKADVTRGVEAWLSGKRPNHGFQLRHAPGSAGRVFVPTSEAPDPSTGPRLILEYEGTVKGEEAVVPEDLQWLLYEEGGSAEDAEVDGIDI